MKELEHDEDSYGLPYYVPKPTSADEAAEILFPPGVGPAQEDRTNRDLPPLMDE